LSKSILVFIFKLKLV